MIHTIRIKNTFPIFNFIFMLFIVIWITRVNIITDTRISLILDISNYNSELILTDGITIEQYKENELSYDIMIPYTNSMFYVWKWTEESMIIDTYECKSQYNKLLLYRNSQKINLNKSS